MYLQRSCDRTVLGRYMPSFRLVCFRKLYALANPYHSAVTWLVKALLWDGHVLVTAC